MPQRERIPTYWALMPPPRTHRNPQCTSSAMTLLSPSNSLSKPSAPTSSRPRAETKLDGAKPNVTSSEKGTKIQIGDVIANVDYSGETPLLSVGFEGQSPILEDLPNRSYCINGDGVAHYTLYNRKTFHAGLGEKAAPMDLSGRRFQLSATDSFGYDVHRTDPLYKNIPLLINATPQGCVAMFSTSHTRGEYSIGSEMDGMWGFYKVYRQDFGGLEEYIITGKTLKDIVQTYAELAGFPLLVPRWAFGYLSGGMKYSMLDSPPAGEALIELANKMKEHDIPCSAYQMSSGYTVAEHPPKNRHVFTWNNHRFPDPEDWIKQYHKLGMRLIANVKPYLTASHPEYEKLKEAGGLFTDSHTKKAAVTKLWSAGGGERDDGGHIDFTSEAGYNWWYNGIKKLAEEGIDCMWNDNNEYTIPDDEWQCALNVGKDILNVPEGLEKRPQVGLWGRSLHTELNGKASHDALLAVNPDSRPFVLTRSATAGTLRYACSSWSGDNTTSWDSMRGSTALSLTAGMCLMQCYGHDIGGFEGPQPTPELLLRWVQLGIYSPRFAINCFKTGDDNSIGDVIEPWMHPSITHLPQERFASQRWVGWGYESDPEVWNLLDGEKQYWLGDSMLVGGVFESGASKARIYLPKASDDDEGYLNLNAPYQYLEAGQWVDIDAEWSGAGIPVLGKVGRAIPVGRDVQVLSPGEKENVADLPLDDYRAVEIFPPKKASKGGKWHETIWYEDDGTSAATKNKISSYTLSYTATETEIKVKFSRDESSGFEAPWKTLVVILPPGDQRKVVSEESKEVVSLGVSDEGRMQFELK
ncbi:Alpha-glucosidase 2 [Fusarium culmorum]|uniref:alpha-glucosidase n=1 Tax=Fusarium culmorum TaxID=5516 RepID=A0A2T4GW20_FUSCU|nr:Alpha-glucosidase 2 [Fusarium culmorum]